jgi:hypothetical protein
VEVRNATGVAVACNGAPGRDGVDVAPGRDGVDGAPGRDGVDGAMPSLSSLPEGDPACPAGGIRVRLPESEEVLCNGIDGAVGATGPAGPIGPAGATGPTGPAGADGETPLLTSLAVGDPECTDGGTMISVGGLDAFACNGSTGATGPTGPAGPAGATGAAGPAGPAGAGASRSAVYTVQASGTARCNTVDDVLLGGGCNCFGGGIDLSIPWDVNNTTVAAGWRCACASGALHQAYALCAAR